MSIFMTILSLAMIGQISNDQAQTEAAVEPVQQTMPAEESRATTEIFSPTSKAANTTTEPAGQSEIPDAPNSSASSTAAGASNSPTSAFTAGDRSSMRSGQAASSRIRPPELIAEALTLPPDSTITGQPLPLVQALSASAERRQQFAITRAYWQTAEAVAKYHYCLDQVSRLGRVQSRRGDEASLQAAQAAATAMLREAELAAGSAQYELAGLVQLPADAAPPLPADRPHVGAYRTNYQELFASRPAPDRAKLIDRTLPIRRMGIDQRAIAIQAAQDALIAANDAYGTSQGDLGSLISSSGQLLHQQWTFMETVCRYNQDIAEYAMIVAAPAATPQVLAGFMIISPRDRGQTLIPEGEGGIRPAGYNEPATFQPTISGNGRPTPAPRNVPGTSVIPVVPPSAQWGSSATPSPMKNEPTLAPQREAQAPSGKKEPTPAPPRGQAPTGAKSEPTLAPPRDKSKIIEGQGAGGEEQRETDVPRAEIKAKDENQTSPAPSQSEEPAKVRYSVGDPFSRRVETANKPVAEPAGDSNSEYSPALLDKPAAAPAAEASSKFSHRERERVNDPVAESPASALGKAGSSTALYPALVESTPSVRSKQLTLALHWDRSLPDGAGRPMTLEECLSRQPGGDRRGTVEAFWMARQRAAEYQAVSQEIEFLDNLMPLVLERRSQAEGAAAMLYLRAARLSDKANLQEAQAALIEAQFELALRTQMAAEGQWPLPSTPPHAGQYSLNLESQPRTLLQSWPMRHLTAAIPAYCTSVQEHAASVVAADSARAQAVEKYTAGNMPFEQVLEEVDSQTRQTFDFLQTLTDYNRSIAQYALAVLPPDAQPARIAAALVVQR
jgi:hypothetical protein